jgi:signal transduction histidine kinase
VHATRVKSIFLANMSHEMRTPFAYVFFSSVISPVKVNVPGSAFYGVLGLLWDTDLTACVTRVPYALYVDVPSSGNSESLVIHLLMLSTPHLMSFASSIDS